MPQQTAAAELAGLRAELENPAAASSRPAAATAEPPPAERSESQLQIERFLQELQSALDEMTESTEHLIAEHPLPSVSAAFLLGLAVGWLAARG
jgi:ElaB/YqjD/DUF883 family membrane-anchored ribosome-binding protein